MSRQRSDDGPSLSHSSLEGLDAVYLEGDFEAVSEWTVTQQWVVGGKRGDVLMGDPDRASVVLTVRAVRRAAGSVNPNASV